MPAFNILLAMTLTSAVISITFLLAWRTLGLARHTLSWALAFLAATVHWFTALNQGWFSDFSAYWLVASPSILLFATLWLRGHCTRSDCKILPRNLWPFTVVIYLWIVWTTLAYPHVAASAAIVPATVAVAMFMSAFIVIRHREKTRPAEYATAVSMVLFGLAQSVVCGLSLMQGADGDASYRAMSINILFATVPAGYTGLAVFVLFMVASDLSEEMKELAVRDQLTGLLNRRGFGEQSASAYATARRTSSGVSVVMTDIDRFKNINDDFGHAAGDLALCHFAGMLKAGRRGDDVLARIGGEEFALILPGTNLDDAIRVADELCERVEMTPFDIDARRLVMTASFGVATLSDKDTCLTDAIVRADKALYRSKRKGRNRVDLESSQKLRKSDQSLRPVSAET